MNPIDILDYFSMIFPIYHRDIRKMMTCAGDQSSSQDSPEKSARR